MKESTQNIFESLGPFYNIDLSHSKKQKKKHKRKHKKDIGKKVRDASKKKESSLLPELVPPLCSDVNLYEKALSILPKGKLHPTLPFIPPTQFVLGPSSSFRPGVFFGFVCDDSGETMVGRGMDDDAHILISGGSGQGKTQGIVIPTMATWAGSQIVLDIKGELLAFHAQLPRKRTMVFSPECLDGNSYLYDPFSALKHGGKNALAGNAWALACTLIPDPPNRLEPIWTASAQSFLTAALIYYYDLGVSFVDAITAILTTEIPKIMQEIADGSCELAKAYINKLGETNEKVVANIGMDLNALAPLVADPAMRDALTVSDNGKILDWDDLNVENEPIDIILSLPEEKLSQWEPLIRLMVNQLIKSLEMRPALNYDERDLPPLLVMLDEFPRLGKIPAIYQGLSTLRSRGVTFALCVQSLAQLDEIYGANARKVICDNCSLKVLLAASDVDTQRYCTELVGMGPALDASFSVQYRDPVCKNPIGTSFSISPTRKPYIYPEEFSRLESLIVVSPKGPFSVKKVLFAENPGRFSPLSTSAPLKRTTSENESLHPPVRKEYDEFMKESQARVAKQTTHRSMAEKRTREKTRKNVERIYFQVGKMVCHFFPALLNSQASDHSTENTSTLKKLETLLSLIADLSMIDSEETSSVPMNSNPNP